MTIPSLTVSAWTPTNTATWSVRDVLREAALAYFDASVQLLTPTATDSVEAFEVREPELVPYNCTRCSGVLDFWDDEAEDIYTSEDGEPL